KFLPKAMGARLRNPCHSAPPRPARRRAGRDRGSWAPPPRCARATAAARSCRESAAGLAETRAWATWDWPALPRGCGRAPLVRIQVERARRAAAAPAAAPGETGPRPCPCPPEAARLLGAAGLLVTRRLLARSRAPSSHPCRSIRAPELGQP